jgi:CRISPR-associated endoribonuclease Cas6
MRLSIEFQIEKLPITYNMLFVSLIKETLKKSNYEYFQKLYDYKKSKNFTFAVKMNDFELKDDNFLIKDKLIFNISSPDNEFIINFYNGMLKMDTPHSGLKKMKIFKPIDRKINSNEILIKTLSPICVKNRDGKFLKLDDKNFVEELNYITNICLKNFGDFGLNEKIDLIPVGNQVKNVVVKEKINGFQDKTKKEIMFINAYEGVFLLKGNREDLQVLVDLGLGFRRNQGFGMIEVLNG